MKKTPITSLTLAFTLIPVLSLASGPSIYGKIHTAVENNDNHSSGAASYNEWSMASRSSKIGIKGSEKLSDNLKIGYLIEWQLDMAGDGISKDLKQKNRGIILSGDWGSVLTGKWDTPMKILGKKLAVFRDQAGDIRNLGISSVTATSKKIFTIDQRSPNLISYTTPNFNGFRSSVSYSFDAGTGQTTGTGDNSDNNALSVNGIYNNGPVMFGAAYINYNSDGRTPGTTVDDSTTWRVGGSYKFSALKVIASYTDMESANFAKDFDPSIWKIGATYKLGNNTIKAHYGVRDESGLKSSKCTGGLSTSKCEDGADMWAIGLEHSLSKRTKVYTVYASVDNDNDSRTTSWKRSGGNGAAPLAGNNASTFSLGIIHKF